MERRGRDLVKNLHTLVVCMGSPSLGLLRGYHLAIFFVSPRERTGTVDDIPDCVPTEAGLCSMQEQEM